MFRSSNRCSLRATLQQTHRALLLSTAVALTGCASLAQTDPYEKFNRQVFALNESVDRVALKPAATTYRRAVPEAIQTGVQHFFGNLSDVWTGANNLMQGKPKAGASDFTRVLINSTAGIGGIFDVASRAGFDKHDEDFGQTLGVWGVPAGPYVMLPLLGPKTLRDAGALPVDFLADPWAMSTAGKVKLAGSALRVVDQRASYLAASELIDAAALDKYAFMRDGFLQRRAGKVADGASPSP